MNTQSTKHPVPGPESYKALALESMLYGLALMVAFGLTVSGWMSNLQDKPDYSAGPAVHAPGPSAAQSQATPGLGIN